MPPVPDLRQQDLLQALTDAGASRTPAPLTEGERAAAQQVARRIGAEFGAVLELLDPEHRGASAMSRALGVDRATCQRLVSALAIDPAGPETIVRLPGVQGLRQLLDAVASRCPGEREGEKISAARAAAERLEAFLRDAGGSQRRFAARLRADPAPGAERFGGADDPATRQALFMLAGRVTGRTTETSLHVTLIRPVPGRPDRTEGARVRVLLGHAWTEGAMPLEIGGQAELCLEGDRPAFAALDAPEEEETSGALLPEFCSRPLPKVTARSGGHRVVYVLDPDQSGRDGMDIVAAFRSSGPERHPASLRPAVGEIWAVQNFPARRMVFDTYLHRDIARRCIPSLEVHLWTPASSEHTHARWSTRLPGGPRLEVLGAGVGGGYTSAYPRYIRLMERAFERLGWESEEFIGYRCEVTYPVWRSGYCMRFDFAGNELPQEA